MPRPRGTGDTASPGSSSETWGRLPRGPRGKDPSKKKSAPILAKIFLQVGRDAGRCAAKTAGGSEHHPPSTAARSKCAKSRQLPPGNRHPRGSHRNAWVDVDETRRGPSPHRGPPPLKTASRCLAPPQSSACRSKMCQITSRSRRPSTRPRPRGRLLLACLSQPPWHFDENAQRVSRAGRGRAGGVRGGCS